MDDPSTMSNMAGGRARTLLPDPMGEGFMILSVQLQHLFVQLGEALETVMIPVPFWTCVETGSEPTGRYGH